MSTKNTWVYRLNSLMKIAPELKKKSMYEPKNKFEVAINGTVIMKKINDGSKFQLPTSKLKLKFWSSLGT